MARSSNALDVLVISALLLTSWKSAMAQLQPVAQVNPVAPAVAPAPVTGSPPLIATKPIPVPAPIAVGAPNVAVAFPPAKVPTPIAVSAPSPLPPVPVPVPAQQGSSTPPFNPNIFNVTIGNVVKTCQPTYATDKGCGRLAPVLSVFSPGEAGMINRTYFPALGFACPGVKQFPDQFANVLCLGAIGPCYGASFVLPETDEQGVPKDFEQVKKFYNTAKLAEVVPALTKFGIKPPCYSACSSIARAITSCETMNRLGIDASADPCAGLPTTGCVDSVVRSDQEIQALLGPQPGSVWVGVAEPAVGGFGGAAAAGSGVVGVAVDGMGVVAAADGPVAVSSNGGGLFVSNSLGQMVNIAGDLANSGGAANAQAAAAPAVAAAGPAVKATGAITVKAASISSFSQMGSLFASAQA
ncbi:hypothetical protein HDU96_009377 [Phlyctochytrium bullatum]|nr:hypothetical protein HDU96_009377 [Phlyctochytrium bullatum]